MPQTNPLAVGQPPLDATRPYDHEPISRIPAYIRETRAALFTTDIHNVVFESNVETGDAVFLNAEANIWRRSLASTDPMFADRYRFHGIAHVGPAQRSVRVFGFVSYPFWNFPVDNPVYVSPTEVGKLTYNAPIHTKPLMAGYAVQIDALLIDSSLAYWEQLRNEIWAARGGAPGLSEEFPYLVDRLDSELQRLINVEVEITNARGVFATLQARFDHVTGRIVLLEDELHAARGAFASLGLRLNDSDADRLALWNALGILTADVNEEVVRLDGRIDDEREFLDGEIERIDTELDDRYTMLETNMLFANFSEDLTNALLAVLDGSAVMIDDLWELDADGVTGESTVSVTDGDTFLASSYFLIHTEWGNYCVWYEVSAAGSDPALEGYTSIKVEVLTTDAADVVGTATATAIDGVGRLTASNTGILVTISLDAVDGPVEAVNGSGLSGFTYSETVEGELASIIHVDGLPDYFQVDGDIQLYQGSLGLVITTRSSITDLSTVTDVLHELDGEDLMPRTQHLLV